MKGSCVFEAKITVLPPSVNKMYVYTKWGPRPSSAMKKFKAKAMAELVKQVPFDSEPLDKNLPYRLSLEFYLPALINKGWPGKAKTRYKRRDVSNLVKVVEDVLAQCLGVDDSCFLEEELKKLDGGIHGFVGIKIKVYELIQEDT